MMPGILDAVLVGGAVLAAIVYLAFHLTRKKGCQSCASAPKQGKIKIQLPRK